jgi:hypothetical protein
MLEPMRSALLLLLGTTAWPLSADAQPVAAPPPPEPVPAPYVVVPPPPPPGPYVPPELAAARQRAFEGAMSANRLVSRGQFDEAIANFRRMDRGRYRDHGAVYWSNAFHLDIVARGLIRAGRLDLADRLMASFLGRPSPAFLQDHSNFTQPLFDMRLYIHAGRGDVATVLRLLDARPVGDRERGCYTGHRRLFPQVVAPLHHDPRVAAKLRALNCPDDLIARLDDLASRPIGDRPYDPGLPPRVPAR